MSKKSKKKSIMSIVALVLLCVMAVSGTLAYLTSTSDPVTNTFTAAGGGKLVTALTLNESPLSEKEDGTYKLDTLAAKVTKNTYKVLPGVSVPKDPTVTISGKTEVKSFLYVEAVDSTSSAISWAADDNWTELSGVTGAHGGKVYVYCNAETETPIILDNSNAPGAVNIIKNQTVSVANQDNLDLGSGLTLTFYAYMAQASAGTGASNVYTTCFPYTA